MTRVVVAPVRDFASGERRIVEVGGRSIGVFRVGESFFGIRNRCPHQGGPLCLGHLLGDAVADAPGQATLSEDPLRIACPWHEWYPRARHAGMRVDAWPGKPGHIWGSDPELTREQLLDEFDVDYAVLEVLSGQDCYDHPDFAAEWNTAVNQWQLEEWLEFDPRLRGTVAVPHEYPQLAVAEIERRASDDRFVAVLMPASATDQLGDPKYWPIYEAASESGRPVAFHTGGYVDHRGAGYPSYYLDYHVGNGIVMQSQLTAMVAGGMFEAVPGLRVVLTECGVAWAAALRWSLDAAWELMREDHPRLERRPSEYIRDHVWFTTQPIEEPEDPQHLVYTIEQAELGDRLLFATDYPHWDFDSPKQDLPRAMGETLRRAILCENALALYGLPAQRSA